VAYGNIMIDAAKSSIKDLSLPPKEKARNYKEGEIGRAVHQKDKGIGVVCLIHLLKIKPKRTEVRSNRNSL